MRRRKRPGAKEKLFSYAEIMVLKPQSYKGRWKELLNRDIIHIELGTGRGQFITTLAQENDSIGYTGIEIKEEILLGAARKAENKNINNIRFLLFNVNLIEEVYDDNEVDRIYINFADPWPKKRHYKRRLTHRSYLEKYEKILKPNGEIHFKTDCEELFEFTLNEISDYGLQLSNISLDLYRNGDLGIAKTEYEEKFIKEGKKIYRLVAINNREK